MKKIIPLVMIFSLSLAAWIFDVHHYFNLEALKKYQNFLELFVNQHPLYSFLIYGVVYVAVVVLSLPVAAFMTIAGGFLLGQLGGTMSAVIAATLGASFFFLSAKMASSELLSKKTDGWAQKMQKGFQENALSYLLTLRLIPLFPFVAVNLAAALFQIPLRTFFLGTFFGIIPGSFVYVSLGVALREVIQKPNFSPEMIINPKILIAFSGLGLLSLLPVFYKLWNRRALSKNHRQ